MSTACFTTLIANVVRIDPIKTFPDERQLATFSLAVNRRFKVRGETVEETDYYACKTNLTHLISLLENHINKGDQIIVTGTQSHKHFERRDGSKGMEVEIFANAIQFNLSKKPDANDSASQQGQNVDEEIPY